MPSPHQSCAGNRSSWKITSVPSSLTKSRASRMWGSAGAEQGTGRRLYMSSCSSPLLSQNVSRQGLWPPAAHTPLASAIGVSACCPNCCQQQLFGQRVESGAWFFLVLVRGKKKRWKCLRWRVGLCYVCTLFLYYLHMIITMKLCNGGCNVGLQGFSCPSPPGPFCDFSHSFVAFRLMLNCKALVAGTTSFMYPRSASDNGALAAMRAFGRACHRNYRRE